MHILLLIVYGALASFAIWRLPFLRKSGIRPIWLWLMFVLHVLTGWLHNWIAFRYFPQHGDIWNYFSLSFLYRHRLFSDFNLFLSDNSTWTYITHNGIVFIQMLLDSLSGDDMNINTLLFAFPVFLGNVALFRVFRHRFASDNLAAGSVFLLPSVLFWTACIYREGMLYMLLGFLFYHLDAGFTTTSTRAPRRPPPTPRRPSSTRAPHRPIYYSILLLLLIAYFRLAVAITLLPALLIWQWIEYPLPRPKAQILAASLAVLTIVLLSVPPLRDPILRSVTSEQASFLDLEGHSRLTLPRLDGTLSGVWHAFPAAIRNGFFEPLPGSGGSPIYLAFSIELIFVWIILLAAAIRTLRTRRSTFPTLKPPPPVTPPTSSRAFSPTPPETTSRTPSPTPSRATAFSAACLLFALAGMLTIGLIVPFAGTIVRYRSIYLPFLLAPALHTLRDLPVNKALNRWLANRL